MESQRLVDEIERAYQEFLSAVEVFRERKFEEKWLDRRWGAREITAHLTGWLGQVAGGLERVRRGESLTGSEDWSDVDRWNATFAAHARGKKRHQAMHELQHAMDAFKTAVLTLPDEQYSEGGATRRLVYATGVSHFREHAQMVREWRAREGI